MIFKSIYPKGKANKIWMYKFCTLLTFLKLTTNEFKILAGNIEDKDLQKALLGIAAETNQYAKELEAQLKSLHVNYLSPLIQFEKDELSEIVNTDMMINSEKNIFEICEQSEMFFTTTYLDILNGYFPYPFIRKLISSQFRGISAAFMSMRLLNLLRLN